MDGNSRATLLLVLVLSKSARTFSEVRTLFAMHFLLYGVGGHTRRKKRELQIREEKGAL